MLEPSMAEILFVFFPQTHNSQTKNHMLWSFAALPTCCLTLLISLNIFIYITIVEKTGINYRQDPIGDSCL